MSSPETPQPASNPSSASPQGKATLNDFIEAHSKLVTSIAAFIALSAFSAQIDIEGTKLYFSALTFLVAVLLVFELLSQFPPAPRHWRLELFLYLLIFLMLMMGQYWVLKFPSVWVPLAGAGLNIVIFLIFPDLLTNPIKKAIVFTTMRVFKRELKAKTQDHVSLIVFVILSLMVFGAWTWIMYKYGGRSITIHVPPTKGNTGK